MTDYSRASCPVCKKDFNEEKPVICPDCGAPYHRDCWALSGRCSFADVHNSGFEWKNPEPVQVENTPPPPSDFRYERQNIYDKAPPPEERYILGVSEKEIICFIDRIDPYQMMKYRKIASGQKISLNLFAALLSPFYFFYRRMRIAGMAVYIITLILSLPLVIKVFSEGTATINFSENTVFLLSLLALGFQVLLALYFDFFYLHWMVAKIKYIRNNLYPDLPDDGFSEMNPQSLNAAGEEYYHELRRAGRPGMLYMLLDSFAASLLMRFVLNAVLSALV